MPPSPTAPPPGVPGFDPATLFRPLAAPTDRRLFVAVWGEPKKGKTHFSLTFPEPIYLLDLDMGAEDLAPKFPGKQIVHCPLAPDDPTDPVSLAHSLQKFILAWKWAVDQAAQSGGTVIVDTASQLWRWVQVVKLEQIRQKRYKAEVAKKGGDESKVDYDNIRMYQYDYAEANNAMANLIRRPLSIPGVNVVLIHHAQEKYDASGNATGKMQMRGFGETSAIAPITLQLFKDAQGQFMCQINAFRPDGRKEGFVLTDPTYTMLSALAGAPPAPAPTPSEKGDHA